MLTSMAKLYQHIQNTNTNAIHEGLIRINDAKVDRPFGWYSLLIHMFLFISVEYFVKDMDLLREKEGEDMHVQLWSMDLS